MRRPEFICGTWKVTRVGHACRSSQTLLRWPPGWAGVCAIKGGTAESRAGYCHTFAVAGDIAGDIAAAAGMLDIHGIPQINTHYERTARRCRRRGDHVATAGDPAGA